MKGQSRGVCGIDNLLGAIDGDRTAGGDAAGTALRAPIGR